MRVNRKLSLFLMMIVT